MVRSFWMCALSAVCVLVSSLRADAQQCVEAPSGLVAWYPGESSFADAVSTRSARANGGVSFTAGKVGRAFQLDGTGGWVDVTQPALLSGTVEFWVNPNAIPTDTRLFSQTFGMTGQGGAVGVNVLNDGLVAVWTGAQWMPFHASLSIGVWTHLAFAYTGSTMTLYVNGAPAGTVSTRFDFSQSSIGIGAKFLQLYGRTFNGAIDEFSLYNRPLDSREVQGIYAAGATGKCPLPRNITVDPGAYDGDYSMDGFTNGRGPRTFSVTPGTYFVDNRSGGRFSFDVTLTGAVTNVSNPDAAYGVANTLVFKNTTIRVDPQHYPGQYRILGQNAAIGPATFNVIAGLPLTFDNQSFDEFSFRIDSNGNISGISNQVAAGAEGNVLVLNNATMFVEPRAYQGLYYVFANHASIGRSSYVLIPGMETYFDNYSGGKFLFRVDASGQITHIANAAAAFAVGNELVLNNVDVTVDPRSYAGAYYFFGHSGSRGRATYTLIPGLPVLFDNSSFDEFVVELAADGTIANVSNHVAASAIGTTLTLNSACVGIDPGAYTGGYSVLGNAAATGRSNLYLIPGMYARFLFGEATPFLVNPDGSAQPGQVAVQEPTGSYTFNVGPGVCDSTPPVTSLSVTPGDTWARSDVTVNVVATDDQSGVSTIIYSAFGATRIAETTVTGSAAQVAITAEGVTTVAAFATDTAGNVETPPVATTVRIDRTAPVITCDGVPSGWSMDNVTIACTARDDLSGVAGADRITLSTRVPDGAETADAATDQVAICDVAGNCATAGPVTGVMIDRRAPSIGIANPTESTYLVNQAVTAQFTCTDAGSGIATCNGSVASGGALPTRSAGMQTLAVSAADAAGNTASASVNYTVTFGTVSLHDETRAVKSGATIPLKVRLVDALGTNVSAETLVVTAMELRYMSTSAGELVEDAGSANPDGNFRYDATLRGYIFNLKTTGLGTGTWAVRFIVAGDPTVHSTQFQVR